MGAKRKVGNAVRANGLSRAKVLLPDAVVLNRGCRCDVRTPARVENKRSQLRSFPLARAAGRHNQSNRN